MFFASNIGKNAEKQRKLLKWDIVEIFPVFALSHTGVSFNRLPTAKALLVMNNHLQAFVNKADRSLISFFYKLEYDASGSYWQLSQNGLLDIWLIDQVEVHKQTKKERDQYPAILTKQAWSIKDLSYRFRGHFSPSCPLR